MRFLLPGRHLHHKTVHSSRTFTVFSFYFTRKTTSIWEIFCVFSFFQSQTHKKLWNGKNLMFNDLVIRHSRHYTLKAYSKSIFNILFLYVHQARKWREYFTFNHTLLSNFITIIKLCKYAELKLWVIYDRIRKRSGWLPQFEFQFLELSVNSMGNVEIKWINVLR